MLEHLQNLGLSYYESKAFEVVLKEQVSVKELWKKAGIPAGKVYSVLKLLQQRNLVSITNDRPKKVFVANASDALGCLIEKAQKRQEKVLGELRAFATVLDAGKSQPSSFFDMGTTVDDNRRIQLRSFQEAKKEVCQILNMHHKPSSNRSSKTVWEKEIEKAVRRGVAFRCLYPKDCVLPPLLESLHQKNPAQFQVRRQDTNFPRCDIVDEKKVLVKLVHQDAVAFGGVIFVENERFARNLKSVFEQFWEEAKEVEEEKNK